MRITHADVDRWAKARGLESVQIDGIPEGFSFIKPDITIGGVEHKGEYVAYIPLSDWKSVYAQTKDQLLELYNKHK